MQSHADDVSVIWPPTSAPQFQVQYQQNKTTTDYVEAVYSKPLVCILLCGRSSL